MMKPARMALLSSVALPFALFSFPSVFAENLASGPIIVAQADGLAAAQAEVAAAQAALVEAQASGGDVAAAQARVDAALSALAAAEAASEPESQSVPEPEPEPQPEAVQPPQPEAPPVEAEPSVQPPAVEPAIPAVPEAPIQEFPPQPDLTPQSIEPPQQPGTPAIEPPETVDETPAVEEPAPQPPAAEEPPALPPQEPAESSGGEDTPPPAELQAPPDQPPAGQDRSTAPQEEEPAQAQTPPAATEQEESAVETQLEAQGDDEAVENVRTLREKLREDYSRQDGDENRQASADRRGDGDEQDGRQGDDRDRDGDRRGRQRPDDEGKIVLDLGGRFVIEFGDQLVVRQDSAYESDRFLDRARDVDVEHFPGGYTRTVVTRRDGTRIYTVRNRYGDIISRTRVDSRGRQIVLIDNRDFYRDGRRPRYTHYEDELPPLQLNIPRNQYIVETSRVGRNDIREALLAPPVEAVEHPYALEDIRTSERLRDKVRRVDLNTITFDFGSAAVTPSQFDALSDVGQAIADIVAQSPGEVFLIEGHTDAVGSDTDNLVLSDRRAEAIAVALASNFSIPPENLVTQGYGEQYLKVPTEEPERENRRVTVRRITPLVAQGN